MGIIGSISICKACKKGFILNFDFVCEKLIPPNCDPQSDFILKGNYLAHPFYAYYHS